MRVYANDLDGARATVLFNGEDISSQCVAADSNEGWASLLVKDEDGNYVIDDLDQVQVKRHYGDVVIKLQPVIEG